MTARCRSCRRPLRHPSPDGYGPVCRRARKPATTAAALSPAGREALDHAALADAGQLTIPIQLPLPGPRARRHWPPGHQGRRVRTLPDIATYQHQETQ